MYDHQSITNIDMISETSYFDAFIFTHIPKCGGTSFRHFINESAKKSGISRKERYIPGYNWLSVEKDFHRLSENKKEGFLSKRYKVVAMHIGYGWHTLAAPYMISPFYYTILRKPVNRVLSHYQFFNKGKGRRGVKGLDINDLDSTKRKEVLSTSANLSILYILGEAINGGEVTSMMKDDALENLDTKYDDFGLLEDPEKSIEVLKTKWPDWMQSISTLDHRNKSSKESPIGNVSDNIIESIQEQNRLEIDFYDSAAQLFYDRLKRKET